MQAQTLALRRAKRQALGLLVAVALVFAATGFMAPSLGVRCLQAVTEAAMVGALADWFAVTALFRRIPLPWVGRHTAIIPRNKDRIGDNLAHFVRDRFLDPASLLALIRRNDPAQWLASWLTAPANSALLGRQVARLALAALEMVQDRQVQRFLMQSLRAVLAQVDLSRAAASVLTTLTQGGRHQQLLDDVLARIATTVQAGHTREFIAASIIEWLKREHPLKERMLPSDWLGGKGAEMIAQALESLFDDIAHNPEHRVREALDAAVARLIERLRTDAGFAAQAEQLRHYLLHDEKLSGYLQTLWGQLRQRLQTDLADEHSHIARKAAAMGRWLGQSLASDPALRQSMNARLERWAAALAPDMAQFLAEHISDTVKRWDARELSQLVELHIGKDLQFIRINGTLVGGAIGLLLFLLAQLPHWWGLT
ncbi:DUF445 domain-containing protein [Comamonas endophytica]|uniref:DUF445 domain-containing protein n=1 Tax=Comamonas endophytica TaxID=2949090 RepID=A0ABY6G717_9BURK|nr:MULTISPECIES: DUF445 domain-containing protein [unclassified Acidovorax]MCD2510978.1 DUF445 domain-containing protein [Acidovorax sp. D4N7]UYG50387.1 DUF445 domain-containing protein [Acidovorax sp. 5MLIR]